MNPGEMFLTAFFATVATAIVCITYYNIRSERISADKERVKADFEKEMASKGYEKRFRIENREFQSCEAEWVKAPDSTSK